MSSAMMSVGFLATTAEATGSIARHWDEALLASIRKDIVHPPRQARNLFHLSGAMYDGWAAYDANAMGYLFREKFGVKNVEAARSEAISYASYRILRARFAASPNAAVITPILVAAMVNAGYDASVTTIVGNTPAAVGNRIAAQYIAYGLGDGSHEDIGHASYLGSYVDVNPPLVVAIGGDPLTVDPNRYQSLALTYFVDQGGNVIPGGFPAKLAPFWGFVKPFGLTAADRSATNPGVSLDQGPPAALYSATHATYRAGHEEVVVFSSMLSPDDGVTIDVSPSALGNSPLGTNAGTGHAINPATGLPYPANNVKRGDWARCLAEFWADGPTSETPPGHWNSLLNDVMSHPLFERRLFGKGQILGELEYEVKAYMALNGALHDAAITAWGHKGHYDSSRPITAIRYMAFRGQCSDAAQPSYNAAGIHLVPGVIELITTASSAPGQRHAGLAGNEGKIAVKSWPGSPLVPSTQYSGVQWILGTDWVPYQRPTFVTPPFAGYMSGHSTFSRAGARVLTGLTGSEFFPGGVAEYVCPQNSYLVFEDGPSQTLTFQWATYFDAADQSGLSRLYGGIHPFFDDFPGRVAGDQIGLRALARAPQYWNATLVQCEGDLDANGAVDAADLTTMLSMWGTANVTADIDGDGIVDAPDLARLLSAWGLCP
ncbi:MAG: hypothetical protein EXS10_03345 [Phycisphaerales bacterium]|nr:hypothetical protein [Phycisphaerales bacterium]